MVCFGALQQRQLTSEGQIIQSQILIHSNDSNQQLIFVSLNFHKRQWIHSGEDRDNAHSVQYTTYSTSNLFPRMIMSIFKGACVLLMLMSVLMAADAAKPPGDWGCHAGYCWSRCENFLPLNNPWCWTTMTHSQSHSYVKCENKYDCNRHWKCASACSAIWEKGTLSKFIITLNKCSYY